VVPGATTFQAAHPQQVTPLPAAAPAAASKGDNSAATSAPAPASAQPGDAAQPAGNKGSGGDAPGRQEPRAHTICYDSASSHPDHQAASDAGSQRSSIDMQSSAHAQLRGASGLRPPPQLALPWRRREGDDEGESNQRVSIDSIAPVLIDEQPATPVRGAPSSPDLSLPAPLLPSCAACRLPALPCRAVHAAHMHTMPWPACSLMHSPAPAHAPHALVP
jgi:hypothetical protein